MWYKDIASHQHQQSSLDLSNHYYKHLYIPIKGYLVQFLNTSNLDINECLHVDKLQQEFHL